MRHLQWTGYLLVLGLAGVGCGDSPAAAPTDSGAVTDLVSVDTTTGDARIDVTAVDAPTTDLTMTDTAPAVTCGTMLGGPCDPVSGSGCPAGEGCYLRSAMGGTLMGACVMAGGGEWGASCSTNADCREGFACLPSSVGGTMRVCTRLCCEGDNATCRNEARGGMPGAVCDRGLILTGTMIRICQTPTHCDPQALSANGCPMDRGYCSVLSMDGSTSCTALSAHPGVDGELCCTEGCQPGYICMGMAGTCDMAHPIRVCRRVCNPTMASADGGMACPAMLACLGIMGRPMSFGSCVPRM